MAAPLPLYICKESAFNAILIGSTPSTIGRKVVFCIYYMKKSHTIWRGYSASSTRMPDHVIMARQAKTALG